MPRRLVVAGIVIMAAGLAMMAYLDPIIRIIFFGQGGLGLVGGGGTNFTRTGFAVTIPGANFSNTFSGFGRGASGSTTSLVSVATIIVFVATVIGLLLTIAGSFAAGRGIPTPAGPAPAAKSASPEVDSGEAKNAPSG
jgi:hypothetical protein